MNKNTSQELVPKLRFPEFKYAGEWKRLRADKVFQQISNKNHNSDLPILAITQEYGAIPRELIDYNVSVTEKSIESYKVVEVGDFVISLRSFQGGVEYSNYEGICSPAYVILRKKIELNESFFKQYFKTPVFIRDLNRNLEGLRDGKMISYKQFSDLSLPFPHFAEQQKIANCLSNFDELITAHIQKYGALQLYKKGLMQNLFPAEGETIPTLRFPEFESNGNWKPDFLGNLGTFIGGGTPSKTESEYWQGDIPWISSSDVSDESINDVTITRFITKKAIKNSATKLIPSGSILLVSRVGVGKLAIIDKPICTSQDFLSLTPTKDNPKFLGYYLKSNRQALESISQGMAIKGFTKEDVSKLSICIPKLEEQQKIANCLSSIDSLITVQAQKIEELKNHKKGLMQQLFPVMDEVSE